MSAARKVHEPGHLVVITSSYPSCAGDPSGHFVQAEVHALRGRGGRVTVLAPRPRGALPSGERDVRWLPAGDAFGWPGALARLREQPLRALGVLRFVLAARRELALLGDVERVIAHFVVPAAWPIAALASHAPLEVVAHGSDVRLVERLPAFFRRHLARALRKATIRCVSAELAARLERALGRELGSAIRVAAPPLELDEVPARAEARAELGVAQDARVVVVVGRLLASKRVNVALGAARLVSGTLIVVIGDGPERAALERSYPEARFVGRVPRNRALAWIAAADVLLTASRLEGAPSVVREARALGTRVVALPAGDLERWAQVDAGLCVLASVT
jgi:teichuronic acid biosynthesis glycosyltransferase TuaC